MRLALILFSLMLPLAMLTSSCTTSRPVPRELIADHATQLITDLPSSTACDDVVSCSCTGTCGAGLCVDACASTWCMGVEADTACKVCLADTSSGCGEVFAACINPPLDPPASCCGSIQACTSSTVASLCEEEEHVDDCGAAACMTCCTETPSGCSFTAFCAAP